MTEKTLKNMKQADLLEALMSDNTLAFEFDRLGLLQKFYAISWSYLLINQPHFIDKAKEYSHGWAGILAIKPELAKECKCWRKFDSLDWVNLLRYQPQFADKCTEYNGWNELNEFDSWNWCHLLKSQPQFADKCDKWNEFTLKDWRGLLFEHPQLADKCKKWDKTDSENWCELIRKLKGNEEK